jgi:hypothetical protein
LREEDTFMDFTRHKPKAGQVWRSFQGTMVEIITTATNKENHKEYVVYKELGVGGWIGAWAQDIDTFMSEIDTSKRMGESQKYTFELI